jgi:hypothetical protein
LARRFAGKWKLHTVSAASNKRGEIVLRIKKTNLVMAFSHAKESKEPATPGAIYRLVSSLSPLIFFLGRTELTSSHLLTHPQA